MNLKFSQTHVAYLRYPSLVVVSVGVPTEAADQTAPAQAKSMNTEKKDKMIIMPVLSILSIFMFSRSSIVKMR